MCLRKCAILSAVAALAGCQEKPVEPCPDAGRDFIEQSVSAYFARSFPKVAQRDITILHDEKYESYPKSWMVSVDLPDRKYIALVSCSGKVELSGRDREP